MLTNANITIMNRKRRERSEVLMPTVIKNVSWHSVKATASGNMADGKDSVKVRIPIDADFGGKTYIDSIAYESMSEEEAKAHWTLSPNDIVVRGIVDGEDLTQTELLKSNQNVFLINDFSDNTDMGSDAIRHWRIGGS